MTKIAGFGATAVDGSGNTLASVAVEVRLTDDNTLAVLFSDNDGLIPLSNPFIAELNGDYEFFTSNGLYDVTLGVGASPQVFPITISDTRFARSDDAVVDDLTLTAIAATIGVSAADLFVYDTSTDPDGGAWRNRVQHTSWYNEALNTATRGATRDFPAVVGIVVGGNKVTLYDFTRSDAPMWMVFTGGVFGDPTNSKAVSAVQGIIGVVTTGRGAPIADFVTDYGEYQRGTSGRTFYRGGLVERNTFNFENDFTYPPLVNDNGNDVAMTVLPDAPIDPATGLQRSTVPVGTDGGVSVINNDGIVYNSTIGFTPIGSVVFDDNNNLFARRKSSTDYLAFSTPEEYTTADGFGELIASTTPNNQAFNLLSGVSTDQQLAYDGLYVEGGSEGLGIHVLDYADFNNTASIKITSTYNTGDMHGDIKGAWLADTDATDVSDENLVTDPDMDTASTFASPSDFWAWTADVGDVNTTVAGKMRVTAGISGYAKNTGAIVSGLADKDKSFAFRFTISGATTTSGAGVRPTLFHGGTGSPMQVSDTYFGDDGDVEVIIPAGTSDADYYIGFFRYSGHAGILDIDNVSLQQVVDDRSVNDNPLTVHGTVPVTPVASGAELVAYGPFTATDYLEQPYNSDLPSLASEVCVLYGWIYRTSVFSGIIAGYGAAATGQRREITLLGDGTIQFTGYAQNVQSTGTVLENVWSFVMAIYDGSGGVQMYINGVLAGTGAVTLNDIASETELRVGVNYDGSYPFSSGSIALIRISATAPTAERIKATYERERFMFQPDTAVTLYGTSDEVTAVAHDPVTNLRHVGTPQGRSDFQGYIRVSNTTDAVGAAIAANNKIIMED